MRQRTIMATTLAVALVAAACGSSSSPSVSPGPSGAPSASSSTTPDALLVQSLETLPDAVVQIESAGVFRDPTKGEVESASRGSGFIISRDGIAVTNNHVVTGANTVTVWVGRERSEHSATVLGASECSDLAVIGIGGLRASRYLSWYEGDIAPGLDIYAAGFPLGEPEFTLTRGIVSRAHGLLDENWAWVENSIEHDANTNPGSSGGPIVTADGHVVGVHYAGDSGTLQHWAIARDEAVGVIEDLQAGHDVASIGVNGEAIEDEDHPGIWVSSVHAGSPAGKVGLKPGDIITKLGGLDLAVDGTMKEYCQVLRSHDDGDVLPIEVYRGDDRGTHTGELNGSPIDPGFSFLTALGGKPSAVDDIVFDTVTDSKAISFEAPVDWLDVAVDDTWTVGGVVVGSSILVAEDVQGFRSGYTTPGLFVGASTSLAETQSVDQRLDADRARFERSCDHTARETFSRGGYSGSYDLWQQCEGTATKFITIAALPEDEEYLLYIQFQAVKDADLPALDRLLATLKTNLDNP
jgi:serine protease Do